MFCLSWFQGQDLYERKVLDFGCGARALTINILEGTGAALTGVDISPVSVRTAQERAVRTPGFEQSRFDVGDCEALPYDDSSFDYVVSLGTLSCVRLDSAYAEMRRVLKRGGSAFIIDTLSHNPLFSLNRWVKLMCGQKRAWTVGHTRKLSDFERAGQYFQSVEMHFFDLLTPFLTPAFLMIPRYTRRLQRWSWSADRFLLQSLPPTWRRHALKIVCILTCPAK